MTEFRLKTNEKGFTLVELMVVVVIIGILVAIAVPLFGKNVAQANRTVVEANLRSIDSAIVQHGANNQGTIEDKSDLAAYLQTWPEGPDGVEYDLSADGKRAVISKAGDGGWWFTTEDVSLPINWD